MGKVRKKGLKTSGFTVFQDGALSSDARPIDAASLYYVTSNTLSLNGFSMFYAYELRLIDGSVRFRLIKPMNKSRFSYNQNTMSVVFAEGVLEEEILEISNEITKQ